MKDFAEGILCNVRSKEIRHVIVFQLDREDRGHARRLVWSGRFNLNVFDRRRPFARELVRRDGIHKIVEALGKDRTLGHHVARHEPYVPR